MSATATDTTETYGIQSSRTKSRLLPQSVAVPPTLLQQT